MEKMQGCKGKANFRVVKRQVDCLRKLIGKINSLSQPSEEVEQKLVFKKRELLEM